MRAGRRVAAMHDRLEGRWQRAVIMALLAWALVGYILYPALSTLLVSLDASGQISFSRYAEFFSSPSSLETLGNSVLLGALTVIICGLVGTGLAFLVHFFQCPQRRLLDKLLLLPVVMPGIIIVFAFVQLYGESGLVTKTVQTLLGLAEPPWDFSGLPGILLVHAYTQYVYFYITVSISVRQIDSCAVESARSLGASRLRVLRTIILPYLAPALLTSSAVTFMTGVGAFAAPSIIGGGYKVLTTQILLSKANNYMGMAATEVVVLTLVSLGLFIFFRRFERRRVFTGSVKGVPLEPVRVRGRALRAAMLLAVVLLVSMVLLPFAAIIVLSFVDSSSWMVSIYPQRFSLDNYIAIFTKPRTFRPFWNSTVMSLAAAGGCLLLAVPASWVVEKTRSRLRWAVEILAMLPWAMPASAVAVNIINATSTPSVFTFNQVLVGSFLLLPIGYLIKSLPIMVKTVQISFQGVHDGFIEASKSLGASGFRTMRKVTLPMLAPGMVAGFLLVFVRSLGEYTVSAFLYTASNKPISTAMVNAIFEYDIGLSMAYGALLILLTVLLSLSVGRLRKMV